MEERRFVVFACMFTPEIGPGLDEAAIAEALRAAHPPGSESAFFRGTCDRLHLFVAKGEGARVLTEDRGAPSAAPTDGAAGSSRESKDLSGSST
ncbi:MAG: hypothetical protein ACREC5_03635 [Thermoplasmata archaeon]